MSATIATDATIRWIGLLQFSFYRGGTCENGFASEDEARWCMRFLAFFVRLVMTDRLGMTQPPFFRKGEQSSRVVMASLSNHER